MGRCFMSSPDNVERSDSERADSAPNLDYAPKWAGDYRQGRARSAEGASVIGARTMAPSRTVFKKRDMMISCRRCGTHRASLWVGGSFEGNNQIANGIGGADRSSPYARSNRRSRRLTSYGRFFGHFDRPMRTQWTIETMLPIMQSVMKPPMNHRNSGESAIRMIRRPK